MNSTPSSLIQSFVNIVLLLERQARETPNEIAIAFKNDTLTYSELDQKSNQLARYLQKIGVKSETFVGCSLSNSSDLIITMLGILKAGGVYIPLDPSYPKDRLGYMLKDSSPPIVLTEEKHLSLFANSSAKIVQLNAVWQEACAYNTGPLDLVINKNSLAYIMYTSGSTGQPKGIMVEHEAFAHAAVAHRKYYPKGLKALLSSASSFDVSILVVFHLLTSGGTIYIPFLDATMNAEKLTQIINEQSISYILCVPSLYSMLLERSQKLYSLKVVGLTGENMPKSIFDLHPKFAPHAILYNEYGPTEYAVGSTIGIIYDPNKKQLYPINIGQALPDTDVYVLDEKLQPSAKGVKGEIFIGGKGLSKGYLNKPELTVEKFVSYNNKPVYRTGDFGRILEDGNLEFLGRMDYQVKIRGNRVELGEIEHALSKYDKINEAVVIIQKEPEGSKYLVAYFTPLVAEDIQAEVKQHLKKHLPKYMVPSILIQIKEFPRTPNNKIDRNALLNLGEKQRPISKNPLTQLEKLIFEAWQNVLHVNEIGKQDNFFDLGGDSLGLARLQSLLEKRMSVKITITLLLQYPTISQLAEYLNRKDSTFKPSANKYLSMQRRIALQKFKNRVRR